MTKFTQKEKYLLIALVEADKANKYMMRGFRKLSQEEKTKDIWYNDLIKKLEEI